MDEVRWRTLAGKSAGQIAISMQVTKRTVYRYRELLRRAGLL